MIKNNTTHFNKVVILGGGGVGKSSITIRFITNNFVEDYDATIEDSYRKVFNVDQEICNLEILDTAGQEEFKPLVNGWIRSSEGFILVYDVTNRQTFEEVKGFYENIVQTLDKTQFPLVLVGNKCDLIDRKKVDKEEGKKLANSWGCPFIEVSAKEKINDTLCFYEIVKQIRRYDKTRQNKFRDESWCLIL